MLIDWFTVCAQSLNFLILVWLLKHFLYKPILRAIDTREKKIAAELADADAKKVEAKKERDDFEHKNEEFEQQKAALMSKATDEANAQQKRLLADARQAADAISAKRQESIRNDAHNLNQAISLRMQQEVFAIARKALTDLATVSLEERMGEVFTRRLREMDGNAKNSLGHALTTLSGPALIRSAFELSADQRAAIQNAINETFAANVHLRFETSPDLVSGIELTANGQKLAWSIADYLSSLENSIAELMKKEEKPEPKPETKPVAQTPPQPDTKAAPKPEPTIEPKAAPKPGAKAEPDTKPKAAPDPVAQTELSAAPKIPELAATKT
jgi:F-type H+-transporting ATPase subunit b